jgi:apolipoprotein N-acyltransferase
MGLGHWQVWAGVKRWLRLFERTGEHEEVIGSVNYNESHRRKLIGRATSSPAGDWPPVATWPESFIFAGGSSFLLLLAILFPDYWYVSFFALTPFLYRAIKAAPGECLRLGFIFGLSFFTLSLVDLVTTSPLACVLKVLSGTALFTLFAWSLGWARQRWGFNPFILVFLWIGLEMGLVKLGFVGGLLGETGLSHSFFGGMVALFGFLAASAIIVLFNSLLVLTIIKSSKITRPGGWAVPQDERVLDFFFAPRLFGQRVYLVPESRAPPLRNLLEQHV